MRLLFYSILWLGISISSHGQTITNTTTMEQKTKVNDSKGVIQLRIYKIVEKNKKAFYDRFQDHVFGIMKKYDFHILDTWETNSNGSLEFVYLLKWADEAMMKKQWGLFMADAEWNQIKDRSQLQYGTMVESVEDRVLMNVLK